MDGWMDGWVDRRKEELIDGWADDWIYGWMNGWIDGWSCGWTGEWMTKWMDAWIVKWMNELINGWLDAWINGWMIFWIDGRMNEFFNKWLIEGMDEWVRMKRGTPVWSTYILQIWLCADHATPSIRKSWYYFAKNRRSLGRHSSLADQSHGVYDFKHHFLGINVHLLQIPVCFDRYYANSRSAVQRKTDSNAFQTPCDSRDSMLRTYFHYSNHFLKITEFYANVVQHITLQFKNTCNLESSWVNA
jgi:hypothetical protein